MVRLLHSNRNCDRVTLLNMGAACEYTRNEDLKSEKLFFFSNKRKRNIVIALARKEQKL